MRLRMRSMGGTLLLALVAAAALGEGRTQCVPVEPTDPAVDPVTGSACAAAADCGPGYECYTLAPGGYCMPGAPGGPTACREPEHPCPEGTTCSPLPWHQISGVCLAPCQTVDDCRPGYLCNYVELFPGEPDTPRSPGPVCWAVCEFGADQTCNDNPIISSLHGRCLPDGTCECLGAFAKNPETGRCL